MNNHDQDWESEMSSAFDRRVRDLHEAPLTLDLVKGKAVSIRRRRRAATAGAMVAAAAVIVPIGVLAGSSLGDERSQDVAPATQSPTAIDTPTDTPVAPTGPGYAYIVGADYHRKDGSVYELPAATYDDAATLGNRVVAERQQEGGERVVDVIEDGVVVDSYPTSTSFSVSDAGDVVALVTTAGDMVTLWDDGERVLADGFSDTATPVAVTGGPDCDEAECQVWFRFGGAPGEPEPGYITSDGTIVNPKPDAQYFTDANADGLVGVVDSTGDDLVACGGLYSVEERRNLFEGCDHIVRAISPTGEHVIATPSYASGLGYPSVSILDSATGEETGRYAVDGAFVAKAAWIDDDTAVVQVYSGAGWFLISLETDGELAELTEKVPGDDVDATVRLAH